jgi:superfamily II DNA/RNA helicase
LEIFQQKKVGRKKHLKVLVLAPTRELINKFQVCLRRLRRNCRESEKTRLRRREAKPTNGFTERYEILVATPEGYDLISVI